MKKFIVEKIKDNILYIMIFILMGFLIGLNSTICPIYNKYIGVDSSVFIYMARQMMNNKVPYINTFDHKGPLIYLIDYIGLIIGNGNTIGIWILEVVSAIVSLFIIFKISKMFVVDKKKALLVTLWTSITFIIFFDEGNLVEEFALPFICFAFNIFLKILKEKTAITKLNSYITGLCLGCVLMLRPNMIPVWIIYYPFIFFKLLAKKEYKKLFDFSIFNILGVLTIILPFLIYLINKNAFKDFIYSYLLFNFKYSDNSKRGLFKILFFYIIKNKTLILAITSFFTIKSKDKEELCIDIILFLFLIFSLIIVILPRNPYLHYAIILTPCIIVPLSNLLNKIDNKEIISCVLICTSIILCYHIKNGMEIAKNKEINTYLNISNYINANVKQNEKICVIGNCCLIYLLTDTESASKYAYQLPIANIDSKIKEEFLKDLETCDAKFIVIANNFNKDIENKINELLKNRKYIKSETFDNILIREN